MVGVVRNQLHCGAEDDVEDCTIVVACSKKCLSVGIRQTAALTCYFLSELAQRFELGIIDWSAVADGCNVCVLNARHFRKAAVTGHAVSAFIFKNDCEVNDVALDRRESGFVEQCPSSGVGLERLRAFGEHVVQVRNEAPRLLDAVEDVA